MGEVQQENLVPGKYYRIEPVGMQFQAHGIPRRGQFLEHGEYYPNVCVFSNLNIPLHGGTNHVSFITFNRAGQLMLRYYDIPQPSQPGGRRRIKRTKTNNRSTKRRRRRSTKRRR